jgi:hypothetical protein
MKKSILSIGILFLLESLASQSINAQNFLGDYYWSNDNLVQSLEFNTDKNLFAGFYKGIFESVLKGNELSKTQKIILAEKIFSMSFPNEQIKHPLNSDNFNDNQARTLVNKAILESGFLLTEELGQTWDGSNWANSSKARYTYDENNNMIEYVHQIWDGSNWVNNWKSKHTNDWNDTLIEILS